VIDDDFADAFRDKTDNLYIWCNADCYVRRHDLKGLATGMFISEPLEAYVFNIVASQEQIDASNYLFAAIIRECLEMPSTLIYEQLVARYHIEDNPVTEFNRHNIVLFD
jgi:hypothetical protein